MDVFFYFNIEILSEPREIDRNSGLLNYNDSMLSKFHRLESGVPSQRRYKYVCNF